MVKERLSLPKMQKYQNELSQHTYTCSCGHRVVILPKAEKIICSWCNRYVFKSKEEEFKYRIKEKMRRIK